MQLKTNENKTGKKGMRLHLMTGAIKTLQILTVFSIMLLLAAPVSATNVTAVEIRGVVFDTSATPYNTTTSWDAWTFPGFWYNFNGGKYTETLRIVNQDASSLTVNSRNIGMENLQYNTSRSDQKFVVFSEKGKKVENGLEFNSSTKTFTPNTTGGFYARLGWFGDLYVAMDGKANKLAKLIKEQKKDEKQTLKVGATWNLGEGYNLTVETLDTTTSPRQASLTFTKDGKTLDNKIVKEGDVYTYIEKSVTGENDVPVFITYVESIFSSGEDLVQLRYTWLISQNVLEIKQGDEFGVFEVEEANENYVLLHNKETINLAQNSVQPLYGALKFKVADSSTALRFYPLSEKTAPSICEIRGVIFDSGATPYNTTTSWDARTFAGFWYSFGGGKYSETLRIINQDESSLNVNSRVIGKENLQYNSTRSDQKFVVFSEKSKKVQNGLEFNSTTKTFTLNATGGYYARLGWFGSLYVALNGKANKLAKLIKEQKKDEKQTLKVGEAWNIGEGYGLTVKALDTFTSPRQATLIFTKDGKTLDNKVVKEGDVYTYTEKSVSGENNVPVFVTYVESIFSSGEALVQLRYTWLISQNVLEVKSGDEFGVFKVQEANENYVSLVNEDNSINLAQNSVQPLYGDLKFKVADSSNALRFYPYIEQTIITPVVEEKAMADATTPQQTVAPTEASLASEPEVPVPAGTESLEPVQITETAEPSTNTALPIQWNWILFVVVGLIVGYLVLKKD